MQKPCLVGLIFGILIIVALQPVPSQVREPSIEQRTVAKEDELRRLKRSEASMGELHPQREEIRTRIAIVERELEELRDLPNPFNAMSTRREANRDLVEQMSDAELRVLVIRLSTEVRLLQERVARLEARKRR